MEEGLRRYDVKERRGLVVVITGAGKGKTTSALGMVLRAVGHGMRVCVIQFMKGDMYAGEVDGLKNLPGVEHHMTGRGFCGIMEDRLTFEEHRASAQGAVKLAGEKLASGGFDMVVLDEMNNAVKLGLVDVEQALRLIDTRPEMTHLVLTGRDAHPEVVYRADTVSEVREVKHAYRKGVEPQPGVDW